MVQFYACSIFQKKMMLTIRSASAADVPLIRELAEQIWPQTYAPILPAEQIKYMMDLIYSKASLRQQMEEQHQFLILTDAETPLGFASYNEIKPCLFKLQKIYVLPREQGRGLGRFIIDYIIKQIKLAGATALQLNVNRHNKAKDFYERSGFKVIRTEDIDIGNGYFMNDYVMEKKLE
ncbi:MAG TPA: GNAT family N-acetyltransferase [Flavisolibacter sp.]|nr:GNAT family N-acetyltransferase [Flavisolibacter sp.]